MRRIISLFLGFLLASITNLYAQDMGKDSSRNDLDSLTPIARDTIPALAQMPIYNPKRADAKILLFKPEGWISNMPIVGNEDSLSKKLIPHSGKNPFQNRPGDINKKQESDSTQKK